MRTRIQSTAISILLVFSCVLIGASTSKAFTTYMIVDAMPYSLIHTGDTLEVEVYFDTQGEADIALLSISVLFDDTVLQWDPSASTTPTYALYNSAAKLNQYLVPAATNLTLRSGTSNQILLDWRNNILPGGNRDACGLSSFDPVVTCGFHMAVLKFNVIGYGGSVLYSLSNSSAGNIFQLSDGSNPENRLRTVPQPTTAWLLGLGLIGLSLSGRRQWRGAFEKGAKREAERPTRSPRPSLTRALPLLLGGLLLGSLPLSAAKADSLTYLATGVLFEIADPNDAFQGELSLGMPFSGTIQYETGSSPVHTSSGSAQFEWDPLGTAFSISISVGPITASTNPAGRGTMGVTNNGGGYDRFGALAFGTVSTGANITIMDFVFRDSTASAWNGVAIPTELDLADFDYTYMGIVVSQAGNLGVALGQIDTLTLIPEPSTALLLLLGLTGMAGMRRSRGCH